VSKQPFYIHIGVPKTGTTFLQKVLTENRNLLLERGILYPGDNLRGYGHHDIAFLLTGGYPDWATTQPRSLEELIAALKIVVADHAGPVLLSSENFYLYPEPEKLHKLLSDAGLLKNRRPVIIVYLRRQDDAHESWYNQTVKAQGYTHTPQESVESFFGLWDYRAELERWANVFGQQNLLVRPYEKSQFIGGSLLSDFAKQIDLPLEGFVISNAQVNTGLNRDILEFQRLVNALPLDHPERRRFHRELIDLTARTAGSGLFDEAPVLNLAMRQAILERYAEGNAQVAKRYLGNSQLFTEKHREYGGTTTPAGLTTEKLARIMGWLLLKNSPSSPTSK
jgi:hypothetical protein